MRISSRFVKGRYLRGGKDREEEKEEKIDFVLNPCLRYREGRNKNI